MNHLRAVRSSGREVDRAPSHKLQTTVLALSRRRAHALVVALNANFEDDFGILFEKKLCGVNFDIIYLFHLNIKYGDFVVCSGSCSFYTTSYRS